MAKYLLLVPSSPKPGQEDEYNRWYDEVHLKDVTAIPGVVSGRRYTADPSSPHPADTPYMAIYEVETDDPAQVFGEMYRRATDGSMQISDALDNSSAKMMLFKAN